MSAAEIARDALDEARRRRAAAAPAPAYVPLVLRNPCELHGLKVPLRQWIVPGWLPRGSVTLHYSAPGEGKTLLALQLMVAMALRERWVGLEVHGHRSLGLFCEDDDDEVHRRLSDILRATGSEFVDLDAMRWISPVADDNAFCRFGPDNEMALTERFRDLREQAIGFRADLVVLDTAADLYGGNENDRVQVSAFMKAGLGRLARDLDCAVLVNAHPSKSSLAQGSQNLDSGSTAWTGSARSRWSLVTPRDNEGTIQDRSLRTLSLTKANYAAVGEETKLRWVDGSFQPAEAPLVGLAAVNKSLQVERKFLDLLQRASDLKQNLSSNKQSGNYAPKMVRNFADGQIYTKQEYARAMYALLEDGRLRNADYGPPSRPASRLEIVSPRHGE